MKAAGGTGSSGSGREKAGGQAQPSGRAGGCAPKPARAPGKEAALFPAREGGAGAWSQGLSAPGSQVRVEENQRAAGGNGTRAPGSARRCPRVREARTDPGEAPRPWPRRARRGEAGTEHPDPQPPAEGGGTGWSHPQTQHVRAGGAEPGEREAPEIRRLAPAGREGGA